MGFVLEDLLGHRELRRRRRHRAKPDDVVDLADQLLQRADARGAHACPIADVEGAAQRAAQHANAAHLHEHALGRLALLCVAVGRMVLSFGLSRKAFRASASSCREASHQGSG